MGEPYAQRLLHEGYTVFALREAPLAAMDLLSRADRHVAGALRSEDW